ncbi:MAG TPA: hypothetical protein VKN36_09100 [Eudoraea sp.]|nr:hypothetical protein [Eudoraea sp.]
MKTKTLRASAIFLLYFLGFWALLGGFGLISDPTGASLKIPLDYLKGTSFEDYLIPGVILFLANGISSIVIAISVARKVKNYPFFIMVQGMTLILWLTVQLFINKDFYAPQWHITFYAIGLLLLFFGGIINAPKAKNTKELEK